MYVRLSEGGDMGQRRIHGFLHGGWVFYHGKSNIACLFNVIKW